MANKVEAGDRALETARKIDEMLGYDDVFISANHYAWIRGAIQSAMNAQERELREALRKFVEKTPHTYYGWGPESADELRPIFAEAERLLAERGGGR